MVAEITIAEGEDVQDKLDAFREAVRPSDYDICLYRIESGNEPLAGLFQAACAVLKRVGIKPSPWHDNRLQYLAGERCVALGQKTNDVQFFGGAGEPSPSLRALVTTHYLLHLALNGGIQ
jgi:hypothetical protein